MRRLVLPALLAGLLALTGCTTLAADPAPSVPAPVPATSGTGTTTPSLSPSPGASTASTDVTTYHQDAQRTGRSASTPKPAKLAVGWSHDLDGEVYAQPLVVGGIVIVATENDTVYGFDAVSGAQRWKRHLGTPQSAAALPCGNIDPTAGITGTPVYDPASKTVFLVADEQGPHHYLYGLDPATGAMRVRTGADVPGSDPRAEQQRGALALAAGQVYIAYGALYGDCSSYHGEVVTASTTGTIVATLALPTRNGGGIWTPAGPTVSKDGDLYVTSANSAAQAGDTYEYSNGTLQLSPRLEVQQYFAANDWQAKDAADLGQGSTGPTLLDDGLIVTAGKDLPNYVLDSAKLGGIGGQLATTATCAAYGGTANQGTTVFLPCTSGLTAVRVSRAGLRRLWSVDGVTGSPVLGGGAVFALAQDDGVLHAYDRGDGSKLGSVRLPDATTRFATPALSGSRAFIGTTKGIVAVTGV